jgi:hypothetical protein
VIPTAYYQILVEKYIAKLQDNNILASKNRLKYEPFIFFHVASKLSTAEKNSFDIYYCNQYKHFEDSNVKEGFSSPLFDPYVVYIFYEKKNLKKCRESKFRKL